MKKIFYIALLFVLSIAYISCEKLDSLDDPKDPTIQYSPVWPISGEWWVTYTIETSPGVWEDYYGVGYTKLLTFNTSGNTRDSIWITDQKNFWNFMVKSACNVKEKSFQINKGIDIVYDDTTTVTNGKVFIGEAVSKGGNKTDSIYMELRWASDPTTVFRCSGHRRTGFLEDEF